MHVTSPRVGRPRSSAAILLRLLVVAGLLAGCGGSAAILSNVGRAVPGPSAAPIPEGGTGLPAATATPGNAVPRDEADIIYSGTMSLQVTDIDAAVDRASAIVDDLGGYVSGSRRSTVDDEVVARITYRVPSDRWDDALERLRAVGEKVITEETDSAEVTGQIVDLAARIKNLRATESALQAILGQAVKIADVLEVQRELTTTREQIEQLTAQQALLEDQVTFGTLSVAFGLEVVAVRQATEDWEPATEVDRATAMLVEVLQAVATAGIWFGIVWLPILLVIGALIAIVAAVLRRTRFPPRQAS